MVAEVLHVGEDGLDVALGGILPLLVGCRCLVDAAVRFLEFFGSGGSECAVVVAAKGGRCETAGRKESEDFGEVVEKDVFVAGLDGIGEDIFRSGIAEDEELCVPFYTGGVDRTDVVVIDERSYRPGAVGQGVFVCGRRGCGCCGCVRGGICLCRGGFSFPYVGVVAVAFGEDTG